MKLLPILVELFYCLLYLRSLFFPYFPLVFFFASLEENFVKTKFVLSEGRQPTINLSITFQNSFYREIYNATFETLEIYFYSVFLVGLNFQSVPHSVSVVCSSHLLQVTKQIADVCSRLVVVIFCSRGAVTISSFILSTHVGKEVV